MLDRPTPLEGVHDVTDWRWAQDRTNFVVGTPRAGSGWRVLDPTLRGESATHHSTLRFFLVDDGGRRVRAKQSYNDWWIPTVADISFRTRGRPLVVGDSVAFLGRDYRRRDASCGHRFGTSIEFSLEAGGMAEPEWTGLWSALDAAAPEAVAEARASSFARRNYWNRWGRTLAPWDTSEIASLRWSDPTSAAMARAAWALTADRWAPVPGTIDSLGFRGEDEAQFVFRWPMSLDASAWLRVLRDAPPSWRPLIDASEVNRPAWSRTTIEGRDIEQAAMDPGVGNWYFAWREEGRAYELHLRARPGLDRGRAEGVVRGLLS